MEHLTVYRESGRFAGWPANYGLWRQRELLIAVVARGYVRPADHLHARDLGRPFAPLELRSEDGGRSWAAEPFTGDLRGASSLSADEHVMPHLRAARTVGDHPLKPVPVQGVDFTAEMILPGRTGLEAGAESWFYRRSAPGHWCGPFGLPRFDRAGVAARADIVPTSEGAALWLLTSSRGGDGEGGTICVHTSDGGRSFRLRSVVAEADDEGFAIMPSTVRARDGALVSVLRRPHRLQAWRSEDEGHTWVRICDEVGRTGRFGNPPSLVATTDGDLIVVYGRRSTPYALVARRSGDGGSSWGEETTLAGDVGTADFGYPRSVDLAPDRYLTLYYRADEECGDRWIAGVIWDADEIRRTQETAAQQRRAS